MQPFQSTRPRGARPSGCAPDAFPRSFNPRAREGRDLEQAMRRMPAHVSIHAPARGATRTLTTYRSPTQFQSTRPRGARREARHFRGRGKQRFNPRAREGRDSIDINSAVILTSFQSTRPRGARHRSPTQKNTRWRFNPRAREGRDDAQYKYLFSRLVSIHAPARGATTPDDFGMIRHEFQSTRPRGARQRRASRVFPATSFQSTRPRGARLPKPKKQIA